MLDETETTQDNEHQPEPAPEADAGPAKPRVKPEGLVRQGPSRLGFWDETGR